MIKITGHIEEKTIPAGYCDKCNVYFIMEGVYDNLRTFGIPVCRVTDDRTYRKERLINNNMHLAQRSVLMEYGYSVSEANSIPQAVRRRILSTLIDCDVLTRSEVISYLDFFINTKSGMEIYDAAIRKWESDKAYILDYKIGSYETHEIHGIQRRKQ